MPRGGVRPGAGRPRKAPLSFQTQLEVGLWCEEQWRRRAHVTAMVRLDTQPLIVAARRARAQAIALHGRETAAVAIAVQRVFGKRPRGRRLLLFGNAGNRTRVIRDAAQHFGATLREVRDAWSMFSQLKAAFSASLISDP